ncbi:MAG: ABC transporter ATP-binding protein, partial [Gammaproteobacteria bacterium]
RRWTHRRDRAYFHEFWALRDVSFDVKRGETVGIVGRNGSGKSTLLQLICGTLTPTAGTVEVRGRVAALLELGSGFNPEFTGRENVYLNAAVLGLSRAEIDARFDDIVAFADIGEFVEQPVKTYSSGMYVRLAFAVAINVDPEILIVDEALSVGDELFQRKCFARIETIRDKGATILFVSHAAGKVVELCDRALLVDAGELLVEGTPKYVVSRYHKLLYAPANEAHAIRGEIRRQKCLDGHANTDIDVAEGVRGSVEQVDGTEAETFDPALTPASTVNFVPRGAVIQEPVLWTQGGKRVNGLVRGRRYRYGFDVVFSQPRHYVRFGMLIKSITGLPICGTMSEPRVLDGRSVGDGQVARVQFEFDCLLNPGVYFMNAGVFGVEEPGQPETLLHRIADATAFRVLPTSENASTELIDFNCESLVQLDG